jgi:hypothetical protein
LRLASNDWFAGWWVVGAFQSSLVEKLSRGSDSAFNRGGRPHFRLAQFVLRYVVIAAVIFSLYTLDLISLPAVLAGMSSFVVACWSKLLESFTSQSRSERKISRCSGLQKQAAHEAAEHAEEAEHTLPSSCSWLTVGSASTRSL